jgi:hypothetical protein
MDMKKILENMDAAAVGNKPFKGDGNFNDMKKILEGFHKASTKDIINETKKEITESATMSINMTADDAGQVGQLMALMRNAGMDPKPVSADMPMPTPNADKFAQAAMDDPNIPGRDDVVGDQDLQAGALGGAIGGGLGGALGPIGAAAGGGIGSGTGGAVGGAIGSLAGGPLGGAVGGALGGALFDKDVDDPNIPGDDDVEGDQDLQAGMGGALAGGLLGGATGHVLGKGAGAALGSVLGPAGTAIGGEVGGQIGQAVGAAVPGAAGAHIGSMVGDKLTGEEMEELNSMRKNAGLEADEVELEDYENEPEEEYAPYSDVVRGGNDLNRSKKSYPKVAGGDNPMALEDKLREELKAFYASRS